MFTGIYQSAMILAMIVAFYVVDLWLVRRYDPLRKEGSSKAWDYTIIMMAAGVFLVVQPVVLPGLGVYIRAWWGALVQAIGLILVIGGLALHWWARVHLRQFFGEREEYQAGQYLVETGPYAYMRHPIYTSFFTLALGLLLINPSLPTLAGVVYAIVDFSLATRREEKLLSESLPGYADYMARTPRFFPRLRIRSKDK